MLTDGFYINGNASACVERCGDAIVLSFRGTNDNSKDGVVNSYDPNNTVHQDKDQWTQMQNHYALLQPLISAFDAYVTSNGISKVYVTGHSMGGSMAIEYMSHHSGSQYQAVTFGASPFGQPYINFFGFTMGTERKDYSADSRITEVEILKDPVPMAFDIRNLWGNTNFRPGHVIDFGGNKTMDTPNLEEVPWVSDYYAREANHSMDYYRQITDSVDADSWTKILAGAGKQTVLLGGQ
jgi:pimeloyl-ACP methyl ester carboxylesterase